MRISHAVGENIVISKRNPGSNMPAMCSPEVTKLFNEFQSFVSRQVFLYRKECLKEFQRDCECTEPLEKERSQL